MSISFFVINTAADADDFFFRLHRRTAPDSVKDGASVESAVATILTAVRTRGIDAVVEYTRRFDAASFCVEQFAVPASALEQAAETIPAEDRRIILEAIANIRRFHEAQREQSWFQTRPDGSILGQMLSPVDRAGLYVPGGKGGNTPLISSLLMNAVPALAAGVPELAVVSPPQADGTINRYILAAASLLGIREVYAAGSAWAVAALAYGAGPLKAVDVIAGPGNIHVTTAKRLLIGTVGIDMLAGPSEVCVIADKTASPPWVAADLLSQAEHDAEASALCLCTDLETARAIVQETERQCALLPRSDIAGQSLAAYGAVMAVPNMDLALELANRMAPEHLELLVDHPWDLLGKVRHAGAVFMGHYSAEPVGDYFAGPNHVLPTMGTARFSSALSVSTFCKKTSVICATQAFAARTAKSIARLARLEGLEAHARSALCRSGKENSCPRQGG